MDDHATDFFDVTAQAFDRVRGMNDAECRGAELALFELASAHHGAPEDVLTRLRGLPHRAFRSQVLVTLRALVANTRQAGRAPSELRGVLERYLSGDPTQACAALKASDLDRYDMP